MTDPPTDLLLVRHGQAVCNVTGVVGGPRSCTGPTPLGREQARRLAARLNGGEAVTVMYTAPRLRVQETAQIIGRDIRLAPAPDPLLDGPDHGDADGRPWSEVKTDRITRIIQQHQGERVLIVGHAETVEAACTLLLGPGRPRTAPSVRALVLEMAGDNPGWGTKRYAERGPHSEFSSAMRMTRRAMPES